MDDRSRLGMLDEVANHRIAALGQERARCIVATPEMRNGTGILTERCKSEVFGQIERRHERVLFG